MRYDRDPKYLHPFIANKLNVILPLIDTGLPLGHIAKLVSIHRTPWDQFQLFKQGRVFKIGSWVKSGSIVTNLDGFIKMSNHNYLPCLAIDIGIFNGNQYLGNSPHYASVQQGKQFGLSWGGDWNWFKDLPHLEMTNVNFFKHDIKKTMESYGKDTCKWMEHTLVQWMEFLGRIL